MVRTSKETVPIGPNEAAYVSAKTVVGGKVLIQAEAIPVGMKLAIPIDMSSLAPDGRTEIDVSLWVGNKQNPEEAAAAAAAGQGVLSKQRIRIVRVSKPKIGMASLDHNTRAILVDGETFLPLSWTSTTRDEVGPDAMISMMSYMANSGMNSLMIYDLMNIGSETTAILDAAQARGIKIHICLVKAAQRVAANISSEVHTQPDTRTPNSS